MVAMLTCVSKIWWGDLVPPLSSRKDAISKSGNKDSGSENVKRYMPKSGGIEYTYYSIV